MNEITDNKPNDILDQTLNEFRMMVDNIPNYNLSNFKSKGYIDYKVDNGIATGTCLFNNGDLAISRTVVSKGTVWPIHEHPEKEFVIMISGTFRMILQHLDKEEDVILNPNDTMYIKPDTPHMGKAITDCIMIAMTVPASDGYPKDL